MTFFCRSSSDELIIHIECHPCCPQMLVMTTSLLRTSGDIKPYHPFSSLEDFLFTDNCLQNHVKAEAINLFLQQHSQIPNSPITLKNVKQMYRILNYATSLSTKVRIFPSSSRYAVQ